MLSGKEAFCYPEIEAQASRLLSGDSMTLKGARFDRGPGLLVVLWEWYGIKGNTSEDASLPENVENVHVSISRLHLVLSIFVRKKLFCFVFYFELELLGTQPCQFTVHQ